MADLDLPQCVLCGADLKHVRGTCVVAVRCSSCRRGGEIVRDGSGQRHTVCGPAVDPAFGSGRPRHPLIADGGEVTDGDQFLCHACGTLRRGRGAALECCSDTFDDPPLVADGGFEDSGRNRLTIFDALALVAALYVVVVVILVIIP